MTRSISAPATPEQPIITHVLQAIDQGWLVFPCRPREKRPAFKNSFRDATSSVGRLREYWKRNCEYNYGIATGEGSGIVVLDIDGREGLDSIKSLIAKYGNLPKTIHVITGRGRHIYFKHPGVTIRNNVGRLGKGIDVRGDGGYVIGVGSIHPSGKRYRYKEGRSPDSFEIASMPDWLIDLLTEIPTSKPARDSRATQPTAKQATAYGTVALAAEVKKVASAPVGQRNDTLHRSAFKLGQLAARGVLDEKEIPVKLEEAAEEAGLEYREVGPTIASGMGAGRRHPRQINFSHPNGLPASSPTEVHSLAKEFSAFGCTDTDNGRRFAMRHAGCVAHCPQKNGWMVYDGKRWVMDSAKLRVLLAQDTARSISDETAYLEGGESRVDRARWSKQSLSKSAIDRMLDMAAPMMFVPIERFDADPMLLNVENGTIDLRTGELRSHDSTDMITRLAKVSHDPNAEMPEFKRFMRRVLNGDKDLYQFVRRAVGYNLTGGTKEQVFFYLKGRQKNGKSTFVNLIREMLGDYSCHTPTETLLVKQYDNAIPNDLARLQGVRMVTAIESAAGKQFDEARVKAMTGGDPITARFLRSEYFQFIPEFKLWFVANDDPRVRSTDDALWRRIRVIPFDVIIPDDECDPNLPAKLRTELPGILAWAVRGCLEWQRIGLAAPASVEGATAAYRERADHLKRFLAECVTYKEAGQVSSSVLYSTYRDWCLKEHEQPLGISGFNTQMVALDHTNMKTKLGRIWRGILVNR